MSQKQDPHDSHDSQMLRQLRRLQEHSRSNIPAVIASRANTTFTLHREPLPHEARSRVLVIVYPQDPFVGEPEVRTMDAEDIRPGLFNSRVRIEDQRGTNAQPDEDGNYLFWPNTPEFDQINTLYYTTFTLRMYERYARRALPWSFPSPRLIVVPYIGNLGNAFYSEQDRMLGFHEFEMNGTRYHTAWSADIISHEAAHAVLDGLRDLYNESFGLGPSAFHESFGDITAMLVALHDDSLIRRLLEWTHGDLKKQNFVAEVAEELTRVLQEQNEEHIRGQTIYLRNAINDLKALPFDTLSYRPRLPEFELSRQAHNYSRLFTGTFYDVLTGIYDLLRARTPNHIAIYRARDIAASLLITAIECGPVGEFTFADMARAMLSADYVLYASAYRDTLIDVFAARDLLSRKDAESFLFTLNDLPDIRLPESLNSAMASALFLENEVLPRLSLPDANDLVPMAAYRNAVGAAFLTYFSYERIVLEGEEFREYQGVSIDLFGGLTLMFDADGRLRSVIYRPVTEEDIAQAKVMTLDLINAGLIAMSTLNGETYARMPGALMIRESSDLSGPESEQRRLVRYPTVFDAPSEDIPHFVDYLETLNTHLKGKK